MNEKQVRSPFPRTFWVANVMELFERAAYYGLNSVLAVYLTASRATGGLGFGEQPVGFLQGIVYAATYVIPILGGALADRYGYRRMLLVAFSLLASGYFVAGHMSSYALVFLALLVMATGRGALQAHHLRHDRAHDGRVELHARLRHLLLDDQPRRLPGSPRRQRAQGLLLDATSSRPRPRTPG